MKLNTLLLTSAATLMATSVAFAADLPSKKAAPSAGSVQVCKVGGMTGFTVPGTDTCFKIGGFIAFDPSYSKGTVTNDGSLDWGWTTRYRISFDARSNTDIGVVRSYLALDNVSGGIKAAYAQFAGVTAGIKPSLADIYGTSGWHNPLAGSPTSGIDYQATAGGVTFGIGAENPLNRNADSALSGSSSDDVPYDSVDDNGVSSDNPDLLASLALTAGDVGFKVVGALHQAIDPNTGAAAPAAASYNGYAVKAAATAKLGTINLIGFGGMAYGASNYIGGTQYVTDDAIVDITSGGKTSEASSYGAEINTTIGKMTFAFQAARYLTKLDTLEITTDEFDAYMSYTVAKGLTIQPEYVYRRYDRNAAYNATVADSDTSTIYLRIQRDF